MWHKIKILKLEKYIESYFLDIDGVLNSDEYIDRAKNTQGIERHIDIDKVKLLKKALTKQVQKLF